MLLLFSLTWVQKYPGHTFPKKHLKQQNIINFSQSALYGQNNQLQKISEQKNEKWKSYLENLILGHFFVQNFARGLWTIERVHKSSDK